MDSLALPIIIVDADALIALVDTDDPHSARAFSIAKQLQEIEATLLYPATTIAEAATTFQRKLNKSTLVAQIVAAVTARQLLIKLVDAAVLDAATALFKPQALPQPIALSSSAAQGHAKPLDSWANIGLIDGGIAKQQATTG